MGEERGLSCGGGKSGNPSWPAFLSRKKVVGAAAATLLNGSALLKVEEGVKINFTIRSPTTFGGRGKG